MWPPPGITSRRELEPRRAASTSLAISQTGSQPPDMISLGKSADASASIGRRASPRRSLTYVETNLPFDYLGERIGHIVRWSADSLQQRTVDLDGIAEPPALEVEVDPLFNDRLTTDE